MFPLKEPLQIKSQLPNIISVSRIIVAPINFFFLFFNYYLISFIIFFITVTSDFLDGHIARKLQACSKLGSYFDVFGDFSIIISCLFCFTIKSVYPAWIILIVAMYFIQFLVTSRSGKPVYDPIGKYYGSFLFIMLAISILDFKFEFTSLTIICFGFFNILSFISRLSTLWHKK